MFTNAFVFYGRIRRMEYAISLLIFYGIVYFLSGHISRNDGGIYMIALFPVGWFRIAQGAKRCHDLGSSGWWQLIPFYNIWLLFADGEIGRNQYGENPKEDDYPNYPESVHDKQIDPDNTDKPSAYK